VAQLRLKMWRCGLRRLLRAVADVARRQSKPSGSARQIPAKIRPASCTGNEPCAVVKVKDGSLGMTSNTENRATAAMLDSRAEAEAT
jgi:hypothetical protein